MTDRRPAPSDDSLHAAALKTRKRKKAEVLSAEQEEEADNAITTRAAEILQQAHADDSADG